MMCRDVTPLCLCKQCSDLTSSNDGPPMCLVVMCSDVVMSVEYGSKVIVLSEVVKAYADETTLLSANTYSNMSSCSDLRQCA